MARSVSDAALFLDAMHSSQGWSTEFLEDLPPRALELQRFPSFFDAAIAGATGQAPLPERIAFSADLGGHSPVEQETLQVVMQAISWFESLPAVKVTRGA